MKPGHNTVFHFVVRIVYYCWYFLFNNIVYRETEHVGLSGEAYDF
jgi:hypothetical protein